VNATIAADGTATITDDDALPKLSVDDPSVAEGTGGTTTVVFTVTLAPVSGRQVRVGYATTNGTAVAPDDYAAASGTLTFAKGETTKQVSVTVVADSLTEGDETFSLALRPPSTPTCPTRTGTATIRDDDTAAVVRHRRRERRRGRVAHVHDQALRGRNRRHRPARLCARHRRRADGGHFNVASAELAERRRPPSRRGLPGGRRPAVDPARRLDDDVSSSRRSRTGREPDKKLCGQIQLAEGSAGVIGRATGSARSSTTTPRPSCRSTTCA
jgi:hypothetical protein